eukprot:TRINITY_DN7962_c0_g1_i1.p2 TRINITY_DN7962_c0_g1~~TRINITY_DN7962_c0_g1_i1.p2  ORF type:complete len:765 (+),score=285.93 TRINITY_DN7962_c0_g1_i1:139-2433(+)
MAMSWGLSLLYTFGLNSLITLTFFGVFLFARHRAKSARRPPLIRVRSLTADTAPLSNKAPEDVLLQPRGSDEDDDPEAAAQSEDHDDGGYALRPMSPRRRTGSLGTLELVHSDKTLFGWIPVLLLMKDDSVYRKCGPDAYLYLRFQKTVIVLFVALTLIGLGIVLPVNVNGEQKMPLFTHTTAVNLAVDSPLLWVHVVHCCLVTALVFYVLYRLSGEYIKIIKVESSLSAAAFTVQIDHFPKEIQDEGLLRAHFEELFPDGVLQVSIVHDTSAIDRWRKVETEANKQIERFETIRQLHPDEPRRWQIFPTSRCWGPQVDAVNFYRMQIADAREMIQALRQQALPGVGTAFVVFNTLSHVRLFLRHHKTCSTRVGATLHSDKWKVKHAPHPEEIYFHNLGFNPVIYVLRFLLINSIVVVVMFFFTSPLSVVAVVNTLAQQDLLHMLAEQLVRSFSFLPGDAVIVEGYLSQLVLLLMTLIIPEILIFTTSLERHTTKSKENRSVARKVFLFLLFNMLILPSLVLTSLDAVVKLSSEGSFEEVLEKMGGVFPNALFFLNFLMTTALIGAAFKFLQLPWSIIAWVKQKRAVTVREHRAAANFLKNRPFEFGYEYSYGMVVFAITIFFGTIVPMIYPFGLLYFLIKHFADKHNLVYVHGQERFNDGRTLKTILGFAVVCLLLYQLAFFSFLFFIKKARSQSILMAVVMVLTFSCSVYSYWWHRRASRRIKDADFIFGSSDERQAAFLADESNWKDRYVDAIWKNTAVTL